MKKLILITIALVTVIASGCGSSTTATTTAQVPTVITAPQTPVITQTPTTIPGTNQQVNMSLAYNSVVGSYTGLRSDNNTAMNITITRDTVTFVANGKVNTIAYDLFPVNAQNGVLIVDLRTKDTELNKKDGVGLAIEFFLNIQTMALLPFTAGQGVSIEYLPAKVIEKVTYDAKQCDQYLCAQETHVTEIKNLKK